VRLGVDGGDRRAAGGQRRELAAHDRFLAAAWLDQDSRHAIAQAGEALRVGQVHDGDRRVGEDADRVCAEHGVHRDGRAAPSGGDGHAERMVGCRVFDADVACEGGWKDESVLEYQPAQQQRAGCGAAERAQARVDAHDVDRHAPAVATQRRALFEHRGGVQDTGKLRDLCGDACVEPARVARSELQGRLPGDRMEHLACGAGDAAVRDLDGEEQGDADRDPEAGEDLLGPVDAQP